MNLRKIDRIFRLISELLGNISKRWENFKNLLSCNKNFPWKVEINPQKRKFVHFFWTFFNLNYEIHQFFLINWIFFRPNSRNYFQFYVGNISDYIFGKIYDSFVFQAVRIFSNKIFTVWIYKTVVIFFQEIHMHFFNHVEYINFLLTLMSKKVINILMHVNFNELV